MYVEELPSGKLRLVGRYKDPYTNKSRRTSVPLTSRTPQAINKASRLLNEKIADLLIEKGVGDITFGKLVEEWKESHSKTVKPRTMRVYKHPIEKIQDFIADDVLVKNIDVKLLQRFMDDLRSKYADNTVNLIKQPLNLMLRYAVNVGYISDNPLSKVISPKRGKKSSQIEHSFLGSEQIKKIIEEIRSHPDSSHVANFAEVLFLTGMRPGELLALPWSKVDFEKKLIYIEYTLDYSTNGHANAEPTSTKTDGSERVISAPERVLEIFKEERSYQKIHKLERDFVFVSRRGNYLSINTIDRRMKKASDKLFSVKLTAHKYRHAHITLLAELNVPLKAVMQRVGHVDSETTIKIYTHVTEKMGNDLLNKLNQV